MKLKCYLRAERSVVETGPFPANSFFVFCCYFWHETVDKVNKERVLHYYLILFDVVRTVHHITIRA